MTGLYAPLPNFPACVQDRNLGMEIDVSSSPSYSQDVHSELNIVVKSTNIIIEPDSEVSCRLLYK